MRICTPLILIFTVPIKTIMRTRFARKLMSHLPIDKNILTLALYRISKKISEFMRSAKKNDPSTLSQSLFSRWVNLRNGGFDYLYRCRLGHGKERHLVWMVGLTPPFGCPATTRRRRVVSQPLINNKDIRLPLYKHDKLLEDGPCARSGRFYDKNTDPVWSLLV